jgi:proteasome assembly chaperone (PAC2) family protein
VEEETLEDQAKKLSPQAGSSPARPATKKHAIQTMNLIPERNHQVEENVTAIEEKAKRVDDMIEAIEKARAEEKQYVSRAARKAKP